MVNKTPIFNQLNTIGMNNYQEELHFTNIAGLCGLKQDEYPAEQF